MRHEKKINEMNNTAENHRFRDTKLLGQKCICDKISLLKKLWPGENLSYKALVKTMLLVLVFIKCKFTILIGYVALASNFLFVKLQIGPYRTK